MTYIEAIKYLNLMIEPKQDKSNEAIKVAIAVLMEKVRKNEAIYGCHK